MKKKEYKIPTTTVEKLQHQENLLVNSGSQTPKTLEGNEDEWEEID